MGAQNQLQWSLALSVKNAVAAFLSFPTKTTLISECLTNPDF